MKHADCDEDSHSLRTSESFTSLLDLFHYTSKFLFSLILEDLIVPTLLWCCVRCKLRVGLDLGWVGDTTVGYLVEA